METADLSIMGVIVVLAGCAVTVLSAYVVPLWIRVRGQAHGRFAGLCASSADCTDGPEKAAGGPGRPVTARPASNLITA
jgi:hypothetical protein